MPSIAIYPSQAGRVSRSNPLPELLHTPSGMALLEIQGTLNSTTPPTLSGVLDIGKLTFPLYDAASTGPSDTAWHKKVHLYIGKHQRLTGEIKAMAKPIAVLRRREEGDDGEEALEVMEIVRYRIVFTQRPEPMGAEGGS